MGKLVKTKNKEILKVREKHLTYKRKKLDDSRFLIRSHEGPKEVAHFLSAERKDLSVQNSMSRKNIRNERVNPGIFR